MFESVNYLYIALASIPDGIYHDRLSNIFDIIGILIK